MTDNYFQTKLNEFIQACRERRDEFVKKAQGDKAFFAEFKTEPTKNPDLVRVVRIGDTVKNIHCYVAVEGGYGYDAGDVFSVRGNRMRGRRKGSIFDAPEDMNWMPPFGLAK